MIPYTFAAYQLLDNSVKISGHVDSAIHHHHVPQSALILQLLKTKGTSLIHASDYYHLGGELKSHAI